MIMTIGAGPKIRRLHSKHTHKASGIGQAAPNTTATTVRAEQEVAEKLAQQNRVL